MKKKPTRQTVLIFLAGICLFMVTLFLTGAAYDDGASQVGRYRLTVINRNNFPDLFVIDTATGVVKWVGTDEGKPFGEIKGR
ncbi:MAG: hypothetical protein WBG37_10540 [Desulfobacterales bacterium]